MIKPILFNGEMVKAILEGRKTTTRRIIKLPKYIKSQGDGKYTMFADGSVYENESIEHLFDTGYLLPPCTVGDILWVRETWQQATDMDANEDFISGTERYLYAASDTPTFNTWINADGSTSDSMPWRPSIHMPKSAARIFLKVTSVRVERLQGITEPDIRREGISDDLANNLFNEWAKKTDINITFAIQEKKLDYAWRYLWEKTGGDWNLNPWVWVYEFERCEKPEDF